ncbi:MAG TPA: ParB/RepB/Spo0J family partition protein [Gemmatimonadaceae bacterium]|nr:ParB/RepB/Spo0J family partition protein [Gemmatimonadaceae bacterium]
MTPGSQDQPNRQRLGRGLEALLGSIPSPQQANVGATSPARSDPQSIPIAQIRSNPQQPRREFKEAELDELAASLSAHGLLQPILVRPVGDGYELIAGERRLRAASKLGWQSIPAVVRPIEDRSLLTLALVENLQRADLNPIEEAEGYQQLINEFGFTQNQIAEAVAKDRSTIANALRLLQLQPTIRSMLIGGQLTMGHARALLAISDETARIELARQAIARGYTVRDLERVTKSSVESQNSARDKSGRTSQPQPTAAAHSAQLQQITDALRRHLQTDVRLECDDGKSGEIHIRFYTVDDLERLLDRMVGASNRSY